MIFYKLNRKFIDELFHLKEEEKKHMHVFMSSDDEKEQENAWKQVKKYKGKIDKLFKSCEKEMSKVMRWIMCLVKALYDAVGCYSKEQFIRTLEIYGVGIEI